jgi:protein-S-isoprenylcysteine O-methyltransferase Ste14
MHDWPLALLCVTISAYWLGVGVMVARARRRKHRFVGLVPEQSIERYLWLLWVPMVIGWIYVPWATRAAAATVPALPAFVEASAYAALRWIAAVVAVLALLATIRCWARMGNNWRMDVAVVDNAELITDGPFSRIRHPIYAFSMLLSLCSAVIVPTLPMAIVAALNIGLIVVKATNEERHLIAVHGDAYRDYSRRTGRFLPRLSARSR